MSKVIIAGSRTILNYQLLLNLIEESGFTITEVVSGKAKGVDTLGERYARENNIPIKEFPAKWDEIDESSVVRYTKWGKPYDALAGTKRNQLMSEYADALILLWDGKSAGSLDMLKKAKIQNLKICFKDLSKTKNKGKKKSKTEHKPDFRHRERMVEWATTIKENKDAVVIDTEYCGASATDEIISLGIVRVFDGKVLFDSLLQPSPDVTFNPHASRVHNITQEQLLDAPRIFEVWDEIKYLLADNEVSAYNYTADKRMLFQTIRKYSISEPTINWHCVMNSYKLFSGRQSPVSLSTACSELNIKTGNHEAVEDALAAARVIHRIAQNYKGEI